VRTGAQLKKDIEEKGIGEATEVLILLTREFPDMPMTHYSLAKLYLRRGHGCLVYSNLVWMASISGAQEKIGIRRKELPPQKALDMLKGD